MKADEILDALNGNAHLGRAAWKYFEHGRRFYCGAKLLSFAEAEAVARRYAASPSNPQDQPR